MEVEWSPSCPGSFTPGKIPEPTEHIALGGSQTHTGCSGEKKNLLSLLGFESCTT